VLTAVAGSLDVSTAPSDLETKALQPVSVVTTITNTSDVNLVLLGASRNLPVGLSEKLWNQAAPHALKPHGQISLRSEVESKNVGNFVISEFRLTLGSLRTLFLDHVVIHDRFSILVTPVAVKGAAPIDISSLTDLVRNESRLGVGTDFAGLRLATYLDSQRLLDWKAIARFGQLYAREFYLDEEPSTMLIVDASLVSGFAGSVLLQQLYELITSLQTVSALGLVLYSSQAVIATIPPARGPKQRGRVMEALLQSYGTQVHGDEAPHQLARSNEIAALSNLAAHGNPSKPSLRRVGLFARTILPFYAYADSKRSERLREQGAYRAFKAIAESSERTLTLAIADGRTNVEALVEGAKLAARSNHEVALVLLSIDAADFHHILDLTSHLRRVMVARSTPNNIMRAVSAEIIELSHRRTT